MKPQSHPNETNDNVTAQLIVEEALAKGRLTKENARSLRQLQNVYQWTSKLSAAISQGFVNVDD